MAKLLKKTTKPVTEQMGDTRKMALASALKETIDQIRFLEDKRKDLALQLFYEKSPYRDNDIVEIDMSIGRTAGKTVEAKLGIQWSFHDWQFIAFPRKNDGTFSVKHNIVYNLSSITKLVSRESDDQ